MTERNVPDPPRQPGPAADETWDVWEPHFGGDADVSLVDLLNRVLDRGVVVHGDVTISVAGVDLVYLGLNALLTSVTTARESLGRQAGREPRADARPGAGEPGEG